ncbi:hypothetical protein [Oceanobacillus oncorhynchi]|uniref:hypothetical protein n=1 Tax=Oceanobacillus oncorhynchi TaxID=545501 RepID=UPI0034D70B29
MKAKDKALLNFKQRIESRKSIKYKDLKKDDASLLWAIERYYGGVYKTAKALGLTEDDLLNKYGLTRNINKRTLTENEIYNRLIYLKSQGKLSTSAMRTEFNDLRLEISIKKLYGSVKNCLEFYGLERDTARVTKEGLIKDIRQLSDKGLNLTYTFMEKNHSKLMSNATNKFNMGWYDLLDNLEINYTAKRKKFTKETIKKRLDNIYKEVGNIRYHTIKDADSSILYFAYQYYESLIDFYTDMGYDHNDFLDLSLQTNKGFAFERIYKEVLDLLGLKYKFNKYVDNCDSNVRPDFQMEDGIWIDCKLSAWTKTIEDTILKYSPYCKQLKIVFLRGHESDLAEIKEIYNDVEFISFDNYKPFLIKLGRQDIIEKSEIIIRNSFYNPSQIA